MTSNAAAMAANPNAMFGRFMSAAAKTSPAVRPPDILLLTRRKEAARHAQQRRRRQKRVQRRLKDQCFVEREEPRERRETRGDPRRPLAEPVPGREKHEPDRYGAQQHLENPHRRERVGNGKAGGQEIDVERRDEVEPGTEGQVPAEDSPGQFRVRGRVQADIRLEERVIPQLEHDQELENEHYARQAAGSAHESAHFCRRRRPSSRAHPTFLSFRPTFLSSGCTLMFLDP